VRGSAFCLDLGGHRLPFLLAETHREHWYQPVLFGIGDFHRLAVQEFGDDHVGQKLGRSLDVFRQGVELPGVMQRVRLGLRFDGLLLFAQRLDLRQDLLIRGIVLELVLDLRSCMDDSSGMKASMIAEVRARESSKITLLSTRYDRCFTTF
jgi:hypothetical protein